MVSYKYLLFISALSLMATVLLLQPATLFATDDIIIASAGKNGTYYKLATLLAEQFNQRSPDRQLKVIETQGSRENARLKTNDYFYRLWTYWTYCIHYGIKRQGG